MSGSEEAPMLPRFKLSVVAVSTCERMQGDMMEVEAIGTFDVKLTPIGSGESPIGSMSIDKTFHGDLQGTSIGQMLAFRSGVEGSAGYVAMERVTGILGGREGSFTLQHSGLMDKGVPSLTVVVVPDSAIGGLTGLTGTMNIVVTPGRHDFQFRYTLPD
jgi:hypothetical protein